MVGFALPIKDATSSIPIGIFLRGITTSSLIPDALSQQVHELRRRLLVVNFQMKYFANP
jgi:hypothetical protein